MTRSPAILLALLALQVAACAPRGDHPAAERSNATTSVSAVAKGVVDAEAGLVQVRAPRDGTITRLSVEAGARVVAGQPLATLDGQQARLGLGAADADLGARRAQLEVAQAHAVGAEREAARLARLAAQDAAPRQDADQATTAAMVARGEQRQAAQALRVAQARRRIDAYEVEVRVVRAPLAGRIVRRDAVAGAYAPAAGPLFLLEPDGRRVVRAELDESFADRVRPGAAATVTPEFQPGRTYRARVLRVADVLTGAAIAEDATAKADTRVVSVLLTLDGTTDLKIGQRVLVRFTP